MALTRVDLDKATCDSPDCTEPHEELFFHGRCHPSSATWASYRHGILTVACATCKKTVAKIAVARGDS